MQFDTPVNLIMLHKMFLNIIYSKVWVSRHLSDTLIYYIFYKVKVFPIALEYATNKVKEIPRIIKAELDTPALGFADGINLHDANIQAAYKTRNLQ
jgi:hypothetical protein